MAATTKQQRCLRCRQLVDRASDDQSGLCNHCALVDSATLALDASAVIDPVLGQSILQTLDLPGYELLHIIGEGGMGAVVAARRCADGAMVAVKVLPPKLSQNPSLVRRFQREADAMDKLRHPHIVGIIERGRSGPLLYFIMEHVVGPNGRPTNLRQQSAGGLPSEANILRWATQIVDALGYAHAKGIIHRDIKPSNILLDAKGEAKVADFGVASATFDLTATVITRATSAVGTPLYMAPEQYSDPKTIDHRVDVYAVGMLLYEMLTGELPLGVYDPPTHRRAGIKPGWDRIVGRALQSDPTRRFADMAAFRDALSRLEQGDGDDPPPSGVYTSELSCPSCKNSVRASDAACRRCSHPLYAECPGCGATNTRANLICVACNANLVPLWKVRRRWESADLLLEKAQGDADPTLRQQCAERALTELTQAARLLVCVDRSNERIAAASRTAAAVSWRCAKKSLDARDLSATMHYCRRVLAYAPDADAARRVLERCTAKKNGVLLAFKEHVAGKRLKSAQDELQTGAILFPQDGEIAAELNALRARLSEATQAVRERIPALERAKKHRELAVVIDRLERIGVPAKPLIDVKRRTYEALAKCTELVAYARTHAESHTFNRARAAANKALSLVTDDQEAREVLAAVDRNERLFGGTANEIDVAMKEQRWFHADSLLDRVLQAAKEPCGAQRRSRSLPYQGLFVEIAGKIDAGIHRSNVYKRLLIWTLAGWFVWLATIGLTVYLSERFPAGSAASGAFLAFLFGAGSTAALAAVAASARRFQPTPFDALGAFVNGVVFAAGYFLVTRLEPALVDGRFALWALAPWDRAVSLEAALVAAATAAFPATVAAGALRRAIGTQQLVGLADLLAGLFVVGVAWASMQNRAALSELPLALAATGVALLAGAGSKRRLLDYLAVVCLGLVAALAVGVGRSFFGPSGALVARLVELAFLGAMIVYSAPKPFWWEAVLPSSAAMLLLVLSSLKFPPPEHLGVWLTLGAFFHATGVHALRCRREWDPRLHLADRLQESPAFPFGLFKAKPQSA